MRRGQPRDRFSGLEVKRPTAVDVKRRKPNQHQAGSTPRHARAVPRQSPTGSSGRGRPARLERYLDKLRVFISPKIRPKQSYILTRC